MRPKLISNWCRKLSYKISTQAKVERKAKNIAPMMFELAKLNLMSSVLLQDTTTYTIVRWVMKFLIRRYKISLILSIKWMCLRTEVRGDFNIHWTNFFLGCCFPSKIETLWCCKPPVYTVSLQIFCSLLLSCPFSLASFNTAIFFVKS